MDKINPTREEVLAEYHAHQEKIKDMPMIDRTHYNDLQKFLNAHTDIKSQDEARIVLDYLYSLKEEWKEYHQIHPSDMFTSIYGMVAHANSILGKWQEAIDTIQECLNIINSSSNYKWLFQIKADFYFKLASFYYEIDDTGQAKQNIRMAVFHQLTRYNNLFYDKFAFYGFRPIRDYILDGIRDNKISLSNPNTFNDPIDPALLSHLAILIKQEQDMKEKGFLKLQKEVYEEVRITCLSRSQPLPTGIEAPETIVKDPPFIEINKASMWGYYANSHKGICIKDVFPIIFTDHQHQKEDQVLILRNVNYKETYNPQEESYNYTEAFFTKSKDWAHEGECRLVYFQTDGDVPNYKWVDLPENCIKEIYIGYAASEEDKRLLMDALKAKPEIKLFQMQLSSNNLFELEAVEIKREDL